jgi:large subunit ribosomal protein L10
LENPRAEKVAVVDEVKERLTGASAALLTEYRGLTVASLAQLRRQLREAGGDMKVYKNTLVRFAVRDLGLDIDEELLTGPTAIAFVDGDPVNVAKALRDFARTNPALVVKGGLLGDKALSAAETQALADVEPREVLLAKLAGAMAAPMVQFAGLLQALPRNFAYGLKALIDLQGEAEPSPNVTIDDQTQPAAPADEPVTAAEAEAPVAEVEAPEPEAADTTQPENDTETPAPEADAPAAEAPAETEES